MKKILILGATGMIGGAIYKHLSLDDRFLVLGTSNTSKHEILSRSRIVSNGIRRLDVCNQVALHTLLEESCPDVIINCIGVVKQGLKSADSLRAIELNSLLPHRLSSICDRLKVRFIHISTDCVFSGLRGNYSERDNSDAIDLYGQSKALGEKLNSTGVVIRTSCVGREMFSPKKGLLEWFLAQEGKVAGYSKAIFSGITTLELAKVLSQYFLGDTSMSGIWNLSSTPIDKFSLLNIFKVEYQKNIDIIKDESLVIDRSLDSSKFHKATGYEAPDWSTMIRDAIAFEKLYVENNNSRFQSF